MGFRVSIFLLTLVAMLPLGVLYVISDFLGFVLYHVIGYRRRIVRINLTDSFPDKSEKEIKAIEKQYYRFMCDVMVETVKLLHISDAEMRRRVEVVGYETVNNTLVDGRPAVVMLGHYGNWEWAQEMAVYFTDVRKGSIYHTMASPLWDKIFLKIRGRWHHVLLPQKAAVRYLLDRENLPWVFGFIADQRPKSASKHGTTMFLNQETAFIVGPEEIGTRVKADFFYMDVKRPVRGRYELIFKKLEPIDDSQPYPYSRAFWQEFEKTIKRDSALWLWSHNRWGKSVSDACKPIKRHDMMQSEYPIDFVVTWVNMDDAEWHAEFVKYSGKGDNEKNGVSDARFRDYGFLKYWFRGIEKFAPWVRKVHFVTSGQKPEWLDASNPKINLVNHRDFIPEQFLPTYNSVVIERYMHNIPGLAEHFVYFNDDFYIIDKIAPERFFLNGLPRDIAVFQYNPSWSQWYRRIKNNIRIINKHFDKQEVMKQHGDKWFHESYGSKARLNHLLKPYGKFITLRTPHNAQPYLKSTFREVWAAEGDELTRTSVNRFRASDDYTPELFRTWQICRGNFEPYNTYSDTKMFPLMMRPKQAIRAIRNQSYKLVCINDNVRIRNYDEVMAGLKSAFESILPEKSSFEL